MVNVRKESFLEDEKQLISKIQSDEFISKCIAYFNNNKIYVDKIVKLDLNEGKNVFCSTVVWFFTSLGRFDISYNLDLYGGMGILDSNASKKFWNYYKSLIK